MKFPTIDRQRLFGPLLTILITVLYEYLLAFWPDVLSVTIAPLFPLVVWAAYASGLRAGLLSALWVGGYSAWLFLPENILRVVVIFASLLITTVLVGVLKRQSRKALELRRKAKAVGELNGNIAALFEIERKMFDVMKKFSPTSDSAVFNDLKEIYNSVVNLTTFVAGWTWFAKEKERLITEDQRRRLG